MIGVSGFVYDCSGYGEMARRVLDVAASLELTRVVAVCTDGGAQMSAELPTASADTILGMGVPWAVDDHVIVAAPHQFALLRTTEGRQIGYTCWETDKLPESVVTACAAMDLVLVPSIQMLSLFAKHGLQAQLVPIPMRRIQAGSLPVVGIKETDTVYYSMLTWTPRKNPIGLLTAYLTEFTEADTVVLVIKVGGGHAQLKLAQAEYVKLLRALALPHPPRVILVGGQWTPEQIQALHERGDVYVSLACGEAFGIPMADAFYARNRIISTGWGGQLDYLCPEGYPYRGVTLVDYRLEPVVQEYPYFDGTQCWAIASIMAARLALRQHAYRGDPIPNPDGESPVAVAGRFLREALWPQTS